MNQRILNEIKFEIKFPSLARTMPLLLLVLFSIEIMVMYLLPYLVPEDRPWLANFWDASILTVCFSPMLYSHIFKPCREIAAVQSSLAENVLAHVVDGVIIFDAAMVIHSFNSAAEKMFGYQATEMVGGDARSILGELLEGLPGIESGQHSTCCRKDGLREGAGHHKEGGELAIELSLSRVEMAGGWMWLGIIRDIAVRKESEKTVKQTLSLVSATLESTADGIMVRDLDGNLIIQNRRIGEMWGAPPEVMETRRESSVRPYLLQQLKEPEKFAELVEEQYLAPEKVSRNTLDFKDGRIFERFSAPQIVDGSVVGRVVCFRDLTEQKNLEHQLRHVQKMEALGTLAGGIAHDFNNILTVIMGFCSLGTAHLEQGSPIKQHLDQIMKASERALSLTGSLLAYSRKQQMNPVGMELNGTVLKTHKFLARLIGEGIELVTRLSPEKLDVVADGGQIEQVLMNLSANARDAMGSQGSLVIATSRFEMTEDFIRLHGYGRPGGFALISVSDTGSGMDEKVREKIFEPFFTTKGVGRGTGLGLSIVYGIVKQHEGYINVYSEPGIGTTFNIYLPLAAGAEEAPKAEQATPAGGTETILIAEDDADVRALVKQALCEAGYRVLEACDGEEAVQLYHEKREGIDLLLLDVVMPKKNGKETLEEISALSPELPIIFMSGYTADIIDRNGLMTSGVHLISKPFVPNQLLATVRKALDGVKG
jgi:two-component system, cell cycle sensor histidine kinase and response regulator CckA